MQVCGALSSILSSTRWKSDYCKRNSLPLLNKPHDYNAQDTHKLEDKFNIYAYGFIAYGYLWVYMGLLANTPNDFKQTYSNICNTKKQTAVYLQYSKIAKNRKPTFSFNRSWVSDHWYKILILIIENKNSIKYALTYYNNNILLIL